MVYVSQGRPPDEDASCIDLSLEIGQPLAENVVGLRKNASYALLSPNQRAYYLRWLSNGRADRLENIGFALLFFYGLERRLLIDEKDHGLLVDEAVRLLGTYPSFGLFNAHLSLFLAFSLAQIGIESITDKVFFYIFEKTPLTWDDLAVKLLKWDESLLAVALAWFHKKHLPLPASGAMRAARKDPLFQKSLATTVAPDELKALFQIRYREHFDSGLIIKAAGDEREIPYRPLSPSFSAETIAGKLSASPARIPDVLRFQTQFDPVVAILSRCVDDLRSPTPRSHKAILVNQGDARPGPRQIRWCGNGDEIKVGQYRLADPMVYVSEETLREHEASCINLSLPVGKPSWQAAGSLGAYPTYAGLTPAQRANYLHWLSNGRASPLHEINYAYLFFYGLERRLIVDRAELGPIVKETVRLLETYTFSGTFDGYLGRFLAYALARAGLDTNGESASLVFEKSRIRLNEDPLAVALAWFSTRNAPLPAAWAIKLARLDQRSSESVVFDRIPEEFRILFEQRYHERFGDGMSLKAAKRDRFVAYRPVSPSPCFDVEQSDLATKPVKIPNVLDLQSQFAPLVKIWSRCIEELKPVSRILANGMAVGTREEFELLTNRLKALIEHPDKGKWDATVAEHIDRDGSALVEISTLAVIQGLERRAKFTPAQSQSLAQTAEYVGLLIEPDARLTNRPYSWDDLVSLLRHHGGPHLPAADSRYLAASLMLELGVYVAAADGSVEEAEVDQVARFLESQFLLDPPDARRLEALKRVFKARPPNLAGLGKRLHTALSREQREAVGRFLTGIAAANGIIDRKEYSALRSAYRALDLGVNQLNILLAEFHRSSQDPIEVERGEQFTERGETIPARAQVSRSDRIALDEGLLKRLMADTEQVAKMLGEAMREGNPTDDIEQQVILPVVDSRFETLDPRFHAILSQLLSRPMWQKAEFESLARACSLMPEGALDAVNTWAYDIFDDPIIIEQGEELEVQSHLVETLS